MLNIVRSLWGRWELLAPAAVIILAVVVMSVWRGSGGRP